MIGHKVLVAQLCPSLCNPTECSPPGSTIHGIFQARILEWVASTFFRRSSKLRDFPDLGIKPRSSTLQADVYHLSYQGRTIIMIKSNNISTRWASHKLENNNTKEILTLLEDSEPHIKLPSLEVQQND